MDDKLHPNKPPSESRSMSNSNWGGEASSPGVTTVRATARSQSSRQLCSCLLVACTEPSLRKGAQTHLGTPNHGDNTRSEVTDV